MKITKQQLDKFIELYRQEFGIEIDRKTAFEKGSRLLRIVQLAYLPELTKVKIDYEKFKKKI